MSISIKCPFCKAIKSTTPNTQYRCPNCGARIIVGSNGEIKSSKQ